MLTDYMTGAVLATRMELENLVINELLNLPTQIRLKQVAYDQADADYQAQMALAIFDALDPNTVTFTDTKTGQPRPAKNEQERDAAIAYFRSHAPDLVKATAARAESLRALQEVKNRFEAVQQIARLLYRENGK